MYVGTGAAIKYDLLLRVEHLIHLGLNTSGLLGTEVQLTRDRILACIVRFAIVENLIWQHITG